MERMNETLQEPHFGDWFSAAYPQSNVDSYLSAFLTGLLSRPTGKWKGFIFTFDKFLSQYYRWDCYVQPQNPE
jgi:hypothetical protein